jgi:hypothetical protein
MGCYKLYLLRLWNRARPLLRIASATKCPSVHVRPLKGAPIVTDVIIQRKAARKLDNLAFILVETPINISVGLIHNSIIMSSAAELRQRGTASSATTGKGASVEEEKEKLLRQYNNDDGHFSLVR